MSVIEADERAAFDVLYEDTHRKVLAYCVRRTSRWADALDAAADTYVVAWRRFDDLPQGEDGLPWLFGIARLVIANQRRTESRQDRTVAKLRSRGSTPTSGPDDLAVLGEEHRDVLRALARLSENDQELIRLTTWEGLSSVEAAELFGVTRNALDVRLHRARKRLAREYERVHRTHPRSQRARGRHRDG